MRLRLIVVALDETDASDSFADMRRDLRAKARSHRVKVGVAISEPFGATDEDEDFVVGPEWDELVGRAAQAACVDRS